MWAIIAFIGVVLFLAYRFLKQRQLYFVERGIPGPKPKFLLGNLEEIFLDSAPLQLQKWTKQFGKTYGIHEGGLKVIVTSDLDILNDVFAKKFANFHSRKPFPMEVDPDKDKKAHVFSSRGLRWKRQRSIVTPTFSVGALKLLMPTLHNCSDVMMSRLHDTIRNGTCSQPFDIYLYFQEFTLDTIAKIAFAEPDTLQGHPNNPYIDHCRKVFQRPSSKIVLSIIFLSAVFPEGNSFFSWLSNDVLKLAPEFALIDILEKRIAERRKLNETGSYNGPPDFINLFLNAEAGDELDDSQLHFGSQTNSYAKLDMQNIHIAKKLTEGEMLMNLLLFLLAGYDTTSNCLGYASYLLATNPDVLTKAQNHVDTVMDNNGGELTFDAIGQMTYLDLIIKETLRLYPLASIVNGRMCVEETMAGNLHFEPGLCVLADVWSIHHDKTIWGDDADKFRPERFAEGVVRHPMAWMPFGAGPRICIGMKLAYLEMKLMLAKVLHTFNILQCKETKVPLPIFGAATLQPSDVTIQLQIR